MRTRIFVLLFLVSFTLFAGNNKADKATVAKVNTWANNQQLEFIENNGQITNSEGKSADNVLFKASYGSCDIYITDKGISYVFIKFEEKEEKAIGNRQQAIGGREEEENKDVFYYRLDMDLVGATITKDNIIKEEESPQGHYNYFYPHCPEGIYDVKGYGKITIKNIYKGIDWVIYTNKDNKDHPLKYDFIIHPEANYKDIKIKYLNAQSTSLLDNDTKLKIETIAGNIEEGNIYSYQNKEKEISSKYIINNDSTISFTINDYDKTQDLVIDPLVWATYYGGITHDGFRSICSDSQNNIFITGYTVSTDFPIFQLLGSFWQANSLTPTGNITAIILKFNNCGVRLWATFYGGSDYDYGNSISIDSHDNIYILGGTSSINFPTQQLNGAYFQPNNAGGWDDFILKFNNQGGRLWATYYGGSGDDNNDLHTNSGICFDSYDNLLITGYTLSTDFPIQQLAGAYWQGLNNGASNGFILKFNNQGVRLWATYYGGNGDNKALSICVDNLNNIYITGLTSSSNFPIQQLVGAYWQPSNAGGYDVFILKFNNQGARLWATYYGGSNGGESGASICSDTYGNIYVLGTTWSLDFPVQQLSGAYFQNPSVGAGDAFIIKFNNQDARQWATIYGGNDATFGNSISVDHSNNIYITGSTLSTNFPCQQLSGEYFQSNLTGIADVILLKFDKNGVRQWATYYGDLNQSFGTGLTIDKYNNAYFIGEWTNSGANTINPGNNAYYDGNWNGGDDSYILKIGYPFNILMPDSLQSNRNNLCNGDIGNITLTAIGGIGNSLKWYSSDCGTDYIGTGSTITIPSPQQTTIYYARWESDCGVSNCDTITIIVKDCKFDLIIPNIITPNNDGVNDYFVIKGGEEYNLNVKIYNRWGVKVFEDGNYKNNWNGKYKGKDLSDGVYYYLIEAKIPNNSRQKEYHGSLTILR